MSLRIHPNCYSFSIYNLLEPFNGHYTVLIKRPHLETFTFYKMGDFGNFTSFPPVPFAIPEFTDKLVAEMRERVLKALKREKYYHGKEYQFSETDMDSILAWGGDKSDIQKRWGLLHQFPINASEFAPYIHESITYYLKFRKDGISKTRLFKPSKKATLKDFIQSGKDLEYTYEGRGDFDSWIKNSW